MKKINQIFTPNNILVMYCLEDEYGNLNTKYWGTPTLRLAVEKPKVKDFINRFLTLALKDPAIVSMEIDKTLKEKGLSIWFNKKPGTGTRYFVEEDITRLVHYLNLSEGLEVVIITPEPQYLYDELLITDETIKPRDRFSVRQLNPTHQSLFRDIPDLPGHKILYLCKNQKIQNLYVYSVLHKLCSRKSFFNKLKFWK